MGNVAKGVRVSTLGREGGGRYPLASVLLLVIGTGCENIETFTGRITVAPEVAPPACAAIWLLINDDYRYPRETIEGMWGTREGGLYVVQPSDRWVKDQVFRGQPFYRPGTLEYPYWHMEVAYYPGEVWLGAFIDLNGDEVPSTGEPWGAHADNPITDLPRHAPPDDPVTIDVGIDRVLP